MKRILSVLLVPVMASLMAFTSVVIPPEGRMRLSALSDKILLVEITKVTLTDEKVTDGIGDREIKVDGKIVEVIRGNHTSKEFQQSWRLSRVVDSAAAKTKHGEEAMDMLCSLKDQKTGIEECKEGKRYLVIFVEYAGPLFVEVPKDNKDWRSRILARVDPFKPVKKTEPAKQ